LCIRLSFITQEARENRIALEPRRHGCSQESDEAEDFSHDDPEAVKCMFDFIYSHDYGVTTPPTENTLSADDHGLCLHANVYALGEKYQIAALKEAALKKFEGAVETSWSSEDFRNSVRIVFTSTAHQDKGMRNLVTRIISQHRRELAANPDMETTVRPIDGLAYELWKMVTTERGPTCNACRSAYLRKCPRSHGKPGKATSFIAYFMSCDCEEETYCERHRGQQEPAQDSFWGDDQD
jgi:hypothetical protein